MPDTKAPEMVNGQPKAGDGEWSRVGWEPQFGSLNDTFGLGDVVAEDQQTLLESRLDDKFFGGEFVCLLFARMGKFSNG